MSAAVISTGSNTVVESKWYSLKVLPIPHIVDNLYFRLHRSTTYLDAAYCYRRSSVVCLSVRLSVCHNRGPYMNGWTYRDAVRIMGSGGLKEPCIRWGFRCRHRKGQFWEKGTPIVMYKDALPWAVQKQLKRSRCHLGCWGGCTQETTYCMKFGIITHFSPLKPTHDQKFDCLKSKMADSRSFEKLKNRHISATV